MWNWKYFLASITIVGLSFLGYLTVTGNLPALFNGRQFLSQVIPGQETPPAPTPLDPFLNEVLSTISTHVSTTEHVQAAKRHQTSKTLLEALLNQL